MTLGSSSSGESAAALGAAAQLTDVAKIHAELQRVKEAEVCVRACVRVCASLPPSFLCVFKARAHDMRWTDGGSGKRMRPFKSAWRSGGRWRPG